MLRSFISVVAKYWKTLVVVLFSFILIWAVLKGYSFPPTGFGDFKKPDPDFVRGKTLWDWMELLILPIFFAVGAFLLNRSERKTEHQRAEKQAKLEREIANDHQQEASLQSYLDRISELLLKEELRESNKAVVRDVARVRTLTVLRELDPKRKRMVLLFLKEAGLIAQNSIISLSDADLSHADLFRANLGNVNLSGAKLSSAKLEYADLSDTDLSHADLFHADLCNAILNNTNMSNAHLDNSKLNTKLTNAKLSNAALNYADLSGDDLSNADLSNAQLRHANLNYTNLSGASLHHADLSRADLSRANLSGANLRDASLRDANLRHADLNSADLQHADLSGTDLRGVKVINEQLATARSLKGAILPDGTKHK